MKKQLRKSFGTEIYWNIEVIILSIDSLSVNNIDANTAILEKCRIIN
jgi:hypothetical protein